jgi:hypothetical protein
MAGKQLFSENMGCPSSKLSMSRGLKPSASSLIKFLPGLDDIEVGVPSDYYSGTFGSAIFWKKIVLTRISLVLLPGHVR